MPGSYALLYVNKADRPLHEEKGTCITDGITPLHENYGDSKNFIELDLFFSTWSFSIKMKDRTPAIEPTALLNVLALASLFKVLIVKIN